jgi:hypothetical protein
MSKWIEFVDHGIPKGRKTHVWLVHPKTGGMLGEVRWYAPWRQYAFHPIPRTLYERQCLRDIADFCEEETAKQRERVEFPLPKITKNEN